MRLLAYILLAGSLCLVTAGCDSEEFDEARTALDELEDAVSGMEDEDGEGAEPVDFRELRELVPEEVSGMERTDLEGEQQGAMGMAISRVKATYDDGSDAQIDVKLIDIGGVAGFQMLGYGWAQTEVDRETETEFERTGSFDGHRSREMYNSDRQMGEMQVLVSDRFIVEVEGRNVDMSALEQAMESTDLQQLESLEPN